MSSRKSVAELHVQVRTHIDEARQRAGARDEAIHALADAAETTLEIIDALATLVRSRPRRRS